MLRHSVLHSPPNSGGIACLVLSYEVLYIFRHLHAYPHVRAVAQVGVVVESLLPTPLFFFLNPL